MPFEGRQEQALGCGSGRYAKKDPKRLGQVLQRWRHVSNSQRHSPNQSPNHGLSFQALRRGFTSWPLRLLLGRTWWSSCGVERWMRKTSWNAWRTTCVDATLWRSATMFGSVSGKTDEKLMFSWEVPHCFSRRELIPSGNVCFVSPSNGCIDILHDLDGSSWWHANSLIPRWWKFNASLWEVYKGVPRRCQSWVRNCLIWLVVQVLLNVFAPKWLNVPKKLKKKFGWNQIMNSLGMSVVLPTIGVKNVGSQTMRELRTIAMATHHLLLAALQEHCHAASWRQWHVRPSNRALARWFVWHWDESSRERLCPWDGVERSKKWEVACPIPGQVNLGTRRGRGDDLSPSSAPPQSHEGQERSFKVTLEKERCIELCFIIEVLPNVGSHVLSFSTNELGKLWMFIVFFHVSKNYLSPPSHLESVTTSG